MQNKVLVAYASKRGATAEIAKRIGDVLAGEGLRVDVLKVGEVKDLAPYSAVILGSAVYIGKWRKEAVRFVEEHEQALAKRPLWIFSSGPTDEGEPVELLQGWRYPEAIEDYVTQHPPRDTAVFHGVLDMGTLNFLERSMLKRMKVPEGDFRDWDAIESWARAIAAELETEPA